MSGSRTAKPAAKCRSCGAMMDRHIAAKIAREMVQEHKQSLLKQKKAFEKTVTDIKAEHRKSIGKLNESKKKELLKRQRAAEERSRQEKIFFDQEFSRLKGTYQTSLTQIKQAYGQQVLASDELKMSIKAFLDQAKAQFDELFESNRIQLQEQQVWLEQNLPAMLIEKIGKLNNSRENEEEEGVDADTLISEISKRDEQVQQAMEKIKELEARLTSKQGRTIWKRMRRDSAPETYKEEAEPSDPQQEILGIIREIAHERERMNVAREAAMKSSVRQFDDSFGSKMSAKLIR